MCDTSRVDNQSCNVGNGKRDRGLSLGSHYIESHDQEVHTELHRGKRELVNDEEVPLLAERQC